MTRQLTAGALILLGALLFGTASRHLASGREGDAVLGSNPDPAAGGRRRWTLVAISVFVAAEAIVAFALFGESPLVRALWFLGIALLWLPPILQLRVHPPRLSRERAIHLLVLTLILAAALVSRTYRLTTLPLDVDQDFAAEGLQARLIATGEERQIFKFGDRAAPMVTYMPAALTMKVFGTGLAGLNASGVFEGLLIILGTYLLGKELFSARVGLLAAAFLVISYAHLSASRQSGYIDPVFYMTFASYFLIRGFRRQEYAAVVASGIMTAFCLLSYWSGRLVLPLFGGAFLLLAIFRLSWLRSRVDHVVLWCLAVLVTMGPMIVVIAREPTQYVGHTQAVSLFSPESIPHLQSAYQVDSPEKVLREQVRRTVLSLNYYVDSGTQFGFRRPFLDPGIAFFFTLGIGYCLLRVRTIGPAFLLAWLLLGMFFGIFLSVNPPYWGRMMVLLPPIALIAALSLDVLYDLGSRGLAAVSALPSLLATAAVVLIFLNLGALNWRTYVDVRGTFAGLPTRIGRFLAEQPPSTRAFLVTRVGDYSERLLEFRFLAPGVVVGVLSPTQLSTGVPRAGEPTLLIFIWDQADLAKTLPAKIPGGELRAIEGNAPNEIAFYVFTLP